MNTIVNYLAFFYISLDDRPCDAAIDSCGWNIARGWKRMKYADLDNIYLGTDVNIGSDADEEGGLFWYIVKKNGSFYPMQYKFP